jgi:imidazolonepropionase
MTIEAAISAATINGAHALGCAATTGSIEPGKMADLILLNISDYRDLRNCLGTNVVHQTIKNGQVIYREAEVTSHPAEAPVHISW